MLLDARRLLHRAVQQLIDIACPRGAQQQTRRMLPQQSTEMRLCRPTDCAGVFYE